MKLGTLSSNYTDVVPEMSRTDVRIPWVNDFYDGPLQGVAEIRSIRYFFDIVDRGALGKDDESRTYWLIALSAEQLQNEEEWHDLFCRRVGTHFDYTGRAPRPEEVRPDEFYEPYRLRPQADFSGN